MWYIWILFLLFSRSVMSDSLQPHRLQYVRLLCPPLFPRVYSNSCPLSQWCHPTISTSATAFPYTFPASESFYLFIFIYFFKFYFIFKLYITVLVLPNIKMNPPALHFRWPKYWSFSISFPMNIQGWFPLGLTGLISLHSKRLSRVLQHLALIFIDSLKVSLGL